MLKKSVYNITQMVISVSLDSNSLKSLRDVLEAKLNDFLSEMSIELIQPVVIKENEAEIVNDRLVIVYLISASSETIDPLIEEISKYMDKSLNDYLNNKGLIYKLSNTVYNKL